MIRLHKAPMRLSFGHLNAAPKAALVANLRMIENDGPLTWDEVKA